MRTGKFITFEGGEGSGKSTQTELLSNRLSKNGVKTLKTREPGGTVVGEKIRRILVEGTIDSITPLSELLLHAASRWEHLNSVIEPTLATGCWVICDRFVDSTTAYQGYGHQLGAAPVEMINQLTLKNRIPDLTFILDLPVEKGLQRTKKRKGKEARYESMDLSFHERLRKGYLKIGQKNSKRCFVINALQPIEETSKNIWDIASRCLPITKNM